MAECRLKPDLAKKIDIKDYLKRKKSLLKNAQIKIEISFRNRQKYDFLELLKLVLVEAEKKNTQVRKISAQDRHVLKLQVSRKIRFLAPGVKLTFSRRASRF